MKALLQKEVGPMSFKKEAFPYKSGLKDFYGKIVLEGLKGGLKWGWKDSLITTSDISHRR